jgi:hypothetical protein|tara:strand:- start:2299 stop:2535 length:237 start_codon:yes stop_codon:yes gene_type:complete
MARKYVIINSSDVSSIDFSQVEETSTNTLRWNIDETKTFVKFEGDTPNFLTGKTQYNHEEILTILNDINGGWWQDGPQ